MRQFPFSVRAPYFPPLTQRSSSQYPFRFPSYCTHVLRRIFGGERLFHATRVWFRPRTLPSLCLSLCFDQVEFHLAVPTAGGRAAATAGRRSFVRFPLPSPIAISNHSIAHLMKNTLNKREGKKEGKERRDRFGHRQQKQMIAFCSRDSTSFPCPLVSDAAVICSS